MRIADWPADWPLRRWQAQAIQAALDHDGRAFLVAATPASGKTTLGVRLAWRALFSGSARRVVVVAPTVHICKQWERAMACAGLAVQAGRENGAGHEPSELHGVAITYQALAAAPAHHRALALRRATYLICDEPHHMADAATWGAAASYAFGGEHVAGRLLLSGTPFRTDGRAIPWVAYDIGGYARADFAYGYRQALEDGICRPLEMIRLEGEMRWRSKGEDRQAAFAAPLVRLERARRYRTALLAGEWLPSVLIAAEQRLQHLRVHEQPDAGGLVICADQAHAREVAAILASQIGYEPIIVTSDEERASARIDSYARSTESWLVAVRMVAEGVDIPRLRVGVYASTTRTDLHFRQVAGRFIRRQAHVAGEQRAYLYLASDPDLLALARRLADEAPAARLVDFAADEDCDAEESAAVEKDEMDEDEDGFVAHGSTTAVEDGALDGVGVEFSAGQIGALRRACERLGLVDDPLTFGRMGGLTALKDEDWSSTVPVTAVATVLPASEREPTVSEQIRRLRAERRRLVSDIARAGKMEHQQVNRELKVRFGPVTAAGPKKLQAGNEHCLRWLDKLTRRRAA